MKATQQLKDEHQGIKTVLRILDKICENSNLRELLIQAISKAFLIFSKCLWTNAITEKRKTCFFRHWNRPGYRDRGLSASCFPSIQQGEIM